jgi:hypothetical protein
MHFCSKFRHVKERREQKSHISLQTRCQIVFYRHLAERLGAEYGNVTEHPVRKLFDYTSFNTTPFTCKETFARREFNPT